MKLALFLTAALFALCPCSLRALDVGAAAPELSARDETGATLQLLDVYKKGPTLVYFYPKADTSGCTKQACGLRDSFDTLQARGLQVIGVSGDKTEAQTAFKEKYKLPFPLLADEDGAVAKAFGVPVTAGMPKRQSFLVSGGKIVWNDLSVSPTDHVAKVEAALNALKL